MIKISNKIIPVSQYHFLRGTKYLLDHRQELGVPPGENPSFENVTLYDLDLAKLWAREVKQKKIIATTELKVKDLANGNSSDLPKYLVNTLKQTGVDPDVLTEKAMCYLEDEEKKADEYLAFLKALTLFRHYELVKEDLETRLPGSEKDVLALIQTDHNMDNMTQIRGNVLLFFQNGRFDIYQYSFNLDNYKPGRNASPEVVSYPQVDIHEIPRLVHKFMWGKYYNNKHMGHDILEDLVFQESNMHRDARRYMKDRSGDIGFKNCEDGELPSLSQAVEHDDKHDQLFESEILYKKAMAEAEESMKALANGDLEKIKQDCILKRLEAAKNTSLDEYHAAVKELILTYETNFQRLKEGMPLIRSTNLHLYYHKIKNHLTFELKKSEKQTFVIIKTDRDIFNDDRAYGLAQVLHPNGSIDLYKYDFNQQHAEDNVYLAPTPEIIENVPRKDINTISRNFFIPEFPVD